jgi:hypothetical protein
VEIRHRWVMGGVLTVNLGAVRESALQGFS